MSETEPLLPDFPSIQHCLDKLGATADCAEVHGSLCGLLIDNRSSSEWLSGALNNTPASNDLLATEHIKPLTDLYQVSKQQLNDSVLSLELLLPTDDIDLPIRLEALTHWCQGFLFGLGSIAKLDEKNMHTDVKEFMQDLLGITQLDIDETSSNETEQDFAEIVEYIRMGVIYMNELLNPVHDTKSIH